MSTVLHRMHLFNDNVSKRGHLIYMKRKRKGEDSKIAVRQRESVCERQSMAERGGRVGCKAGRWRNVTSKIRIGLQG